MAEVDEQLRAYIDAVAERVEHNGGVGVRPMRRRRQRRVAVMMAAAAAISIVVLAVVVDTNGSSETSVDTTGPAEAGGGRRPVEAGWHDLPASPIKPRASAGAVWTGSEMIVAGGVRHVESGEPVQRDEVSAPGGVADAEGQRIPIQEVHDRKAAAFSPSDWAWRELPELPVVPWWITPGVWTGDEAIFAVTHNVGHTDDGPVADPALLAFSPEQNSWRTEPIPADADQVYGLAMVWTGQEVLLWGYEYHTPDTPPVALRYDPATRAWATFPTGPLPFRELPSAVWTGDEMIVFGGDDYTISNSPGSGDGAAFNPSNNTWRMLATSPLAEVREPLTTWTGSEMFVWGGSVAAGQATHGARYDPATDSWRAIAPAPILGRAGAVVAWTGASVVIAGGYDITATTGDRPRRDVAIYEPVSDTWQLDRGPGPSLCRSAGTWTGREVLIWGGDRCDPPLDADTSGAAYVPPA